jgi:hypothetical protein
MARDDEKRKNFWEEDEDEQQGLRAKRAGESAGPAQPGNESENVDRKIQETKVLMEQTHALYQNYFSGVEKRVPIEKVKLLEAKIAELQRLGVSQTTARFKLTQFIAQYAQMKDLWERKLREKEKLRS